MASAASRALLLASFLPFPAYRFVRPLTAGTLLPARQPWLSHHSPAAVAPGTGTTAAAAVRCFATRRVKSSSSSLLRENSRLLSSRPAKETVAIDGADSEDNESEETSLDEHINYSDDYTTSDDDDYDVERNSSSGGGSATEKTNNGHRPPKETILDDGCDFKHWLIVMEPPPGDPSNPDVTRDDIIYAYIKTLAQVLGSEERARKKIYSVSTRHYFAFGARISEELSYKLKELPKVRWVLPDSYSDVENKEYAGEPFINEQAAPYDPKYHEYWVRHNASGMRCNCSRWRKENMQNHQNRDVPTGRKRSNSPSPPGQQTMAPHDVPAMTHHAQGNMPPPPPPKHGDPPIYQHHVQSSRACETPGSGENSQQCGAPVHQVANQDRQDNPGARSPGRAMSR